MSKKNSLARKKSWAVQCAESHSTANEIKQSHPNVKKFKDYRVMFDKMKNSLDAVIISTPDHTHFHAAITAMELG